MTVGTKSLLFGVHQIFIHPIFVAMAWKRLYGFPKHPILWMCFLLHDIGYFGKKDMDGEAEGQTHPELGARIITKLFGKGWGDFCLYHSRFYCKTNYQRHSKLCVADKLAFCMYPPRFYIFLARLSGELNFYKQFSEDVNELENARSMNDLDWYTVLKRYTLRVIIQTDMNYFEHVVIGKTRDWRSKAYPSVRLNQRTRRLARESSGL